MRSFKTLLAAAFAISALVSLATPAKAQEPRYLHALANLRAAKDWVNQDHRPAFKDARKDAVKEIDMAINDIKKAAHDDGKSTEFTPPPGQNTDPDRPILSARTLLDEAFKDCQAGTDIPQNAGLQARAMDHIGEARKIVNRILHP
jgi:hypothetical protein